MRPDTVPLGSLPPIGVIPRSMLAQVIRRETYGEPVRAFRTEEVRVPEIRADEVLVAVMAAGVNYNNVFAAQGYPIDLISHRMRLGDSLDFHIGGSEGAGIVYQVGSRVSRVRVGDEVVLQGGVWDPSSVPPGQDEVMSPTFRAWGFETNWGSFAQFCVVKELQCLPRPQCLSWEESAVYMLTGATALRMLHHWQPHTVQAGDVVLVWGAAGGLGVMALQLVSDAGGVAVGVISTQDRAAICADLGAAGVLLRGDYHHWGMLPPGIERDGCGPTEAWHEEVLRFGADLRVITGGRLPSIVFEHPGEKTLPTSMAVCAPGGMVVTCAGTTGYAASFGLSDTLLRQTRLQGSHFAALKECERVNEMILAGRLRPILSAVLPFAETGLAHQWLYENQHPPGNMAIRVGCAGGSEQ